VPSELPYICVDRLLHPLRPDAYTPGAVPERERLAALRAKLWPPDQRVLHVRFLGGDPRLHTKVARFAQEWSRYGQMLFVFDGAADALVRVAFDPGASWSLVGTDALDPLLPPDAPTMNLGWLTPATPNDEVAALVLHEFGHVLGLVHEHQSPAAAIPWDRAAVYAFYAGPPNYWSPAEVDRNVLERYSHTQTNHSAFDPHSIMLYPIPGELTGGRLTVGWNRSLSEPDKRHLGSLYPLSGPAASEPPNSRPS
jgi:hypothetical protein